jgi:phage-related protein
MAVELDEWTWRPNAIEMTGEPSVQRVQFGGYVGRFQTDANAYLPGWALTFTQVNAEAIEKAIVFLEGKGAFDKFAFLTPRGKIAQVVCPKWTVRYMADSKADMTCEFYEVNEA